MVEEEKIIRGSNMIVGFDQYINSSSTNPNEFFNFDQHNSVSHHNSDIFWKPSSPSKPIMITRSGAGAEDFSQFDDDSSLQRCVLIPCEPNERPSQGLSLSLSSSNPSTIRIQPFELVRPPQHHDHHQAYFGKQMNNMHEQHDMMTHDQSGQFNIRCSRYLVHAQDLLNEFCNLGTKQNDHSSKAKAQRANQWQDHDILDNINASSSKNKPLNSVEFLELLKRKSKLLQLLEEVDRKYHNYCDQMKVVVSSFEAVAGNGAAKVYSTLASKAMSIHFRCLRDGIVGQIKATKKAIGEKDISSPGATRGETPRLRLLDQNLRQLRAFQQMTMLDSHPWRPQRGLPERSVSILRAWLFEHFLHPYPSDVDKHILARQTGLSRSQVSNWFINARVRLWKPMVEEMYVEETKENDHENIEGVSDRFNPTIVENTTIPQMDQKPTVEELIRRDSDSLSSIINHHESFSRVSSDPFGEVELDFSTYNHNFGDSSGGGGVSLTLGLQQHAGGGGGDGSGGGGVCDGSGGGGVCDGSGGDGVSLYYPKDQMEDCQTAVQYSSLFEGDQGQNLPYRNLMGAQLLHDLAG